LGIGLEGVELLEKRIWEQSQFVLRAPDLRFTTVTIFFMFTISSLSLTCDFIFSSMSNTYHKGLVEEMKLVGFLPMNYTYKRGDHDPFQMMSMLAVSRRRWREEECYSPEHNPRSWYSDVLPGYKVLKIKKEEGEEEKYDNVWSVKMDGGKRKIDKVYEN
jgi:hypothetical protein